jgi:mannosyltransferase
MSVHKKLSALFLNNLPLTDQQIKLISMVFLTLIAYGLRTYHVDYQSLWRDEVDSIQFALRDLPALLVNFKTPGENGPLYYFALHFWVNMTGTSAFAARFFSLLFGVILVPMFYVLGCRLLGTAGGMIAAILIALSPFHIWYAQEAKMYSLLMLTTVLSMYLHMRSVQENRLVLWAGWFLTITLSLYIHFVAVLLIPVQVILLPWVWWRHRPVFHRWLAMMAVLVLPYIPLAVWQLPLWVTSSSSAYSFSDLNRIATLLLLAFGPHLNPWPAVMTVAPFTFTLLSGLLLKAPHGYKDHDDTRFILGAYLLVPAVIFFVVVLRVWAFTPRYLILILPAFYLLIARGLLVLQQRAPLLSAIAALSLVLIMVSSVVYQSSHPIKPEFRNTTFDTIQVRPYMATMSVMLDKAHLYMGRT